MADIYVDPSIAADSGSGTVGDPYGDLQYALDSTTQDSNGDTFHIKAGTDEVLAATLDLTTYGTPGLSSNLNFHGYTSSAGDGGQGGIDCNGYSLFTGATIDYINLTDLHIHGSGSNPLFSLDDQITMVRCVLNDCSADPGFDADSGHFSECHFYDIGSGDSSTPLGAMCNFPTIGAFSGCYIEQGPTHYFAEVNASFADAIGNIVVLNHATGDGFACYNSLMIGNTIYNSTGSGTGIGLDVSARAAQLVADNIVVGFGGTGGDGLNLYTQRLCFPMCNSFYNCTNAWNASNQHPRLDDEPYLNEELSTFPFAGTGAMTFANRFNYFAPVDTGRLWGGAHLGGNRDRGAVQRAVTAGGSGNCNLIGPGGLIG